jgi:hypothetical protein
MGRARDQLDAIATFLSEIVNAVSDRSRILNTYRRALLLQDL